MNILKGYKVVTPTEDPDVFLPAIYTILGDVKYQIGHKTQVDPLVQGPLAVFPKYDDAMNFADPEQEILEIEYKRSRKDCLWIKNSLTMVLTLSKKECPEGTDFADWVLPKTMIDWRDHDKRRENKVE